jgi:hypothetical protein
MFPDTIQAGQELEGTSGAYADRAYFTHFWVDGTPPAEPIGYQDKDADTSANNPPYGVWVTQPSTPNSLGGDFTTACC